MNDLPDTPVGKRFGEFIEILSAPDEITPEIVSKLVHPSFVKTVGSPEVLTEVFRSWSNQFAPFQITVDNDQSTHTVLLVEVVPPRGAAVLLTCIVDESEDHQITGLVARPKARDIDSLDEVDDLLTHHRAVGLSIAVIVDQELAWTRAWGVADKSASAAITPDTLLQCGSISKPVAAFGALKLVEEGVLDLDVDVNEFLNSWKVPPMDGWQPVITIRDLLTHTAGLTVWGFPGYEVGSDVPDLVSVLDGKGNTPAIRSEALPGLTWRYSGGGTCVLQQAMTDVTGKPFPELMRELVLEPFGMKDSTFEQPIPPSLEDRAASGHESGTPIKGRWHVYPEMAPAGLWTTASDLALFAIGVAAALAGLPAPLISKRMATEALTPHRVAPGMGLGLFLAGTAETPTFGHGGANAGFTGRLLSTLDGSLGLVALSNSIEGPGAINDLFRFLADDHQRPELLSETSMADTAQQALMRATPIEHGEAAEVPRDAVEPRMGTYETDRGTRVGIDWVDGEISLRVDDLTPLSMYPLSAREWVSKSIDVRVILEDDRLTLHQLGQAVEAKRSS